MSSKPATMGLSGSEYLGQRSFMLTMFAAFVLHLSIVIIWQMLPKTKIVDVPVQTLNIKLGGGEALSDDNAPPPPAPANAPSGDGVSHVVRDNTADTEARSKALSDAMAKMLEAEKKPAPVTQAASNALDKLMGVERVKPKAKEVPRKPGKPQDKGPIDVRSEPASVAAPTAPVTTAALESPIHYSRQNDFQPVAPKTDGNVLGNSSEANAVPTLTYDQTVKLWIEKFKTQVTVPAGAPDLPKTVVRIRMDRQGNIFNPTIEQSSGFESLDREALNIVRRANPVPPAPADYSPKEEYFDFKIPIIFK